MNFDKFYFCLNKVINIWLKSIIFLFVVSPTQLIQKSNLDLVKIMMSNSTFMYKGDKNNKMKWKE